MFKRSNNYLQVSYSVLGGAGGGYAAFGPYRRRVCPLRRVVRAGVRGVNRLLSFLGA